MFRQELKQKLLQKLTPQQIQVIRLLEIPVFQLEQKIKQEIEENPLLEEGVDETDEIVLPDFVINPPMDEQKISIDNYSSSEDTAYYKTQSNNFDPDEKREEIPFSVGDTFHEQLKKQLGLTSLTSRQSDIANYMVGNIDEDGYLRRDINAIVDDLAFNENIETTNDEAEQILHIIQSLDPAGIGARNLQECLLIQLKRKNNATKEIVLAREIIENYYEEFIKKHYDKITDLLGVTEQKLKLAIDEILKLNPKPGGSVNESYNSNSEILIPDFILESDADDLVLTLNQKNIPELRVNKEYITMIQESEKQYGVKTKEIKEALAFVRQKVNSAKFFIDAIKQRQLTLLYTMNAILEYQFKYFKEGDETQLRPMILKDIADKTGLDISTISRVVNSKSIQTHFGIYPLKYFFSEGLMTDDGEEASSREIKSILKENIDSENKKKPLTDDRLAEILNDKGYQIARRTIAKYREQMNIPVARLRKEL